MTSNLRHNQCTFLLSYIVVFVVVLLVFVVAVAIALRLSCIHHNSSESVKQIDYSIATSFVELNGFCP